MKCLPLAVAFASFFAPALGATLSVEFTLNGSPLEDPADGKFYVYPPEERDSYLAWGRSGGTAAVADGVYDVLVRYRRDEVTRETFWEGVALEGEVARTASFEIDVAELTVEVTSGGRPIDPFAGRYSLHRSGARGTPLASKRPGRPTTVEAGVYDIEVAVRDAQGLKTKWIEGYRLEGRQVETVDLGVPTASLTVTLLLDGRPIPSREGFFRVHAAGRRGEPLGEARSGEALTVAAGTYDVAVVHEASGGPERWLRGVEVAGATARELELAERRARLRIDVLLRGLPVAEAWFGVYRAGDRHDALHVGKSGEWLDVAEGRYDVRCFAREDAWRPEEWLEDREISGSVDVDVSIDYGRASLVVEPSAASATAGPARRRPLLAIVDSSAAMGERLGARTRIEALREAIGEWSARLEGAGARFGLRAFGIAPRALRECRDSSLLLPVGLAQAEDVRAKLALLRPAGLAPIGYSLEQAAADLPVGGGAVVVLLHGGTEECRGTPCAAAAELLRSGRAERIEVVGLGTSDVDPLLSCVGNSRRAASVEELRALLGAIEGEWEGPDRGRVVVFRQGWQGRVAGGALGEELHLAEGRYDLLVREDERTFRWTDVGVRGRTTLAAGPPPQ